MKKPWTDLNLKLTASLRDSVRQLAASMGLSHKDAILAGLTLLAQFGPPLTLDPTTVEKQLRASTLRRLSAAPNQSRPVLQASAYVQLALDTAVLKSGVDAMDARLRESVEQLRARCVSGTPICPLDVQGLSEALDINPQLLLLLVLEDSGFGRHLEGLGRQRRAS